MRASFLHLGMTGVAGTLIAASLLTGTAAAAPVDGPQTQAVDFDLDVQMMASTPSPTVGGEITYKVEVRNLGPAADVPANGVTLVATLPSSFVFVSQTPMTDWDCDAPSVGFTGHILCVNETPFVDGTSAVLQFVAKAAGAGSAIAEATVDGDGDPNALNDTTSITVTAGPARVTPPPGAPSDADFDKPLWGGGFGGGYYGDDYDYDCDFDCF